jgi:tetratricopeptide (TPR) repeat protein
MMNDRARPSVRVLALGRLPGRVLLATLIAFVAWVGMAGQFAPPVDAQQVVTETVPGRDKLQITRLVADAAGPDAPEGSLRFEATVDYQLQTVQQGFLLWLFFEDGSSDSTGNSEEGFVVPGGGSTVNLSKVYTPKGKPENVIVLIGLFRPDKTLAAWSETTPLSMAPLPGRAAFAAAMAARISGDFAKATESLSTAISQAPENGTYYYWRADSQVRLGRYDPAIADYNKALELQPGDRASQLGRGVALLWKEQWQPAISDLSDTIQSAQAPDLLSAWALRARGVARAASGQATGAIADYRGYLQLIPNASDRKEVESWIAELAAR